MFNLIFNIEINFSIEVIAVIISLFVIFRQNKKKGDKSFANFKTGNISTNLVIKLFNFNINSKNRTNIKKY